MKRRAFLSSLGVGVLAPHLASAGVIVINSHRFGGTPTSGDADVQDWLNRVYADGGTVSGATQTAVEAFVAEAKADGYWSTFRRLNLFAGTGNAWKHPLVNTSGAAADTASGAGITYAESTGPVTDGSSYLTTGYTPTEQTGDLYVYLRTAPTLDANVRVPIGCRSADSTQHFRIGLNTSLTGSALADSARALWGGAHASGNAAGSSGAGSVQTGGYHVRRSSTTAIRLYRSGNTVGSELTGELIASTPSQPVYVFALNAGGTADSFLQSGSAIGAYFVGTGMSAAQVALVNTDMQAFQTAMGRNV